MKTMDVSELYQKLERKDYEVFFELEAGFCTAFEEIEEKPAFLKAFIALVNWNNLSSSDGVYAFYEEYIPERADETYLIAVMAVVSTLGDAEEIGRYFRSGIPEEMKDMALDERETIYRVIDDYIDHHFDAIWETEKKILTNYKQEIMGLFSIEKE